MNYKNRTNAGRDRLDHTSGLNFKRIPLSAELDIIRPSAERMAEFRLQRLQAREADRDFILQQLTTFKTEGIWSHCSKGTLLGSVISQGCHCRYQIELTEDVMTVDATRLSNILEKPRSLRHQQQMNKIPIKLNAHARHVTDVKDMFAYPILSDAIRSAAQEYLSDDFAEIDRFSVAYGRAVKKVNEMILEMRTKMNGAVISFCGVFLKLLLPKLFSRCVVADRQMAMLRRMHSERIPILYLLPQRNNWDLVLFHFTLWRHGLPLPYVAVPGRPSFSLFSFLLKRVGGFFINRERLKGTQHSKDLIYRAMLQSYIELILSRGHNLELFLDDDCSDDLSETLLGMVNAACISGPVPDVTVVSVSFGYDVPPSSDPQRPLSLLASLSLNPLGAVRLSLGHPLRLLQFRSSMELHKVDYQSGDAALPTSALLAAHERHFEARTRPLMPCHLLAFLLLTQFRCGVSRPLLERAFAHLSSVLRQETVLGFHEASRPRDALALALASLRPWLEVARTSDADEEVVSPRLACATAARRLHRLSAAVAGVLGLDVARACALVHCRVARGPCVPLTAVMAATRRLLVLLGRGLVALPPCVRPDVLLGRPSALWQEMVMSREPGSLDARLCRVPPPLQSSPGDEAVAVEWEDEERCAVVHSLARAAAPLLEACWATGVEVYRRRLQEAWTEEEMVDAVVCGLRRRRVEFVESRCEKMVRSCLKGLEASNIIERCNSDIPTSISLLDCDGLLDLLQFVETCIVRP